MAYSEIGMEALRAENINKIVKGFAEPKFVLKQVCMTPKSSSWQESYYRESDLELTAATQIARMAAFPQESPLWEKKSVYMQKAGLEVEISHEDVITDNLPVITRAQKRIARAVVKAIDSLIWDTLSEKRSVVDIQTVAVPTNNEWDSLTRANRNPQDDIGDAIQLLAEKNYEADTLILNPKDHINLVTNDNVMDSFVPALNQALLNGRVGKLLGLNVLVSNAVTADYAMVLESKTCATYFTAEGLRTIVKYEEGIKHIVRAWEIGSIGVTDPKAICLITNTAR